MSINNKIDNLILTNSTLSGKKISRAFCSVGSNVFFEFGEDYFIWVSDSSWRITKDNALLIGSGDDIEKIRTEIEKLQGRSFISAQIISSYWDVEFKFEEGYILTTFFNWAEDNQWLVSLPNDAGLEIDCSSESARAELIKTANYETQLIFKEWDYLEKNHLVKDIITSQDEEITIKFSNNFEINLECCAWRLSLKESYIIGCLDGNPIDFQESCEKIKGSKLAMVTINNALMDMTVRFENGLQIETFTCCSVRRQWCIHNNRQEYEGDILMLPTSS